MLQDRKHFETSLDAQLAQWKADLDILKAKAKRAEVGALVHYDQAIDLLQRKQEEASQQVEELKAASEEAWEQVKAGTEKTWEEIKDAFKSAQE